MDPSASPPKVSSDPVPARGLSGLTEFAVEAVQAIHRSLLAICLPTSKICGQFDPIADGAHAGELIRRT